MWNKCKWLQLQGRSPLTPTRALPNSPLAGSEWSTGRCNHQTIHSTGRRLLDDEADGAGDIIGRAQPSLIHRHIAGKRFRDCGPWSDDRHAHTAWAHLLAQERLAHHALVHAFAQQRKEEPLLVRSGMRLVGGGRRPRRGRRRPR